MVFKNELYPIHFYGRVRGKCDGRLQNWPGIVNERPKFLAMTSTDRTVWLNIARPRMEGGSTYRISPHIIPGSNDLLSSCLD